jgi:hypothetical protein
LSTSSRFPEYFGIKTTKREDIKKWMAEKIGIKVDGSDSGAKPAPEIMAQKTLDEADIGKDAKGPDGEEGGAARGDGDGPGSPAGEGSAEEE